MDILLFSNWRQAAILDFVVAQKWHPGTLRVVQGYQHTKFGEDISNSGWVMWVMNISIFFQNGGRLPSWILLQVKNDVTTRCGLSMSTIVPNLLTISQTAAELLRFCVFQNGGRRHLGFGWILLSYYPRSLPDDLKLSLNFCRSDLYFRGYCNFNFQKFGLKCLFGPKNGAFGGFRP